VGYERSNTTLIAQAAGVSVGSLYQYYPNKDAVFSALLQAELAQALSLMRAALEATQPLCLQARVTQLVQALCAYKAANPRLHRTLKTELGRIDGQKILRRLNEQTLSLVSDVLRAHAAELPLADPARAAFMAVNAVDGVVCAALLDPACGLGQPAFARELSEGVMAMLRSLPRAGLQQAAAG
jgi:AcrR family transcriptional regulator